MQDSQPSVPCPTSNPMLDSIDRSEGFGETMRRWNKLVLCVAAVLLAAGCPKGKTDFKEGRRAEHLQDYDAAYDYYQKALKNDPENAQYVIKFNQARFEASSLHVKNGQKLRERGQLEAAASEFQRAVAIDPPSPRQIPAASHRWRRCRRKSSRYPIRRSVFRCRTMQRLCLKPSRSLPA